MNENCKTCCYAYRSKGEATYCLLYNQFKDNCTDYEEVKQPATARKEKQEKTCKTCQYCYHHPDGRLICVHQKLLNWPWVIKESDSCEDYLQVKSLDERIKQATPKLSAAREEEEKCCGACCYMIGEDCYGYGFCAMCEGRVRCSDKCDKCHGDHFVSKEDMERAVEVLEAHNRWRRDDNVTNSQPMCDPKELGKAIDIAVDFIKTYMEL